jgi:hypothetical protein
MVVATAAQAMLMAMMVQYLSLSLREPEARNVEALYRLAEQFPEPDGNQVQELTPRMLRLWWKRNGLGWETLRRAHTRRIPQMICEDASRSSSLRRWARWPSTLRC